jgi:autoinducer 2-degrading protein
MYVTVVYVRVKPDHVDAFINATKSNHEHSVKEEGNLRFDILQDAEDRTRFLLYEEKAARHKSTPHYLTWRETVAEWMAEPRKGVVYEGLFPR